MRLTTLYIFKSAEHVVRSSELERESQYSLSRPNSDSDSILITGTHKYHSEYTSCTSPDVGTNIVIHLTIINGSRLASISVSMAVSAIAL